MTNTESAESIAVVMAEILAEDSYCAGIGSGFYKGGSEPLRQKDKVYMFVSSGQTGLPAPNVGVGVFAFGLLPDAI